MKLAVPYENGTIYQHFGHTEQFKLYTIENHAVASSEIVPTMGSGHGALAGFLQHLGVEALICGGIGMGAKNALANAGICLYGGVAGAADLAVQQLLEGTLPYHTDATCSHHHGEAHDCASHRCGNGSCH